MRGARRLAKRRSCVTLRAELEGRGVDVKDGRWGYRLMVIADPDGNELWFPYEGLESKGTLKKF